MRYDTFSTINYKGVFIHSKHDRLNKSEVFTVLNNDFKSLHAAKLYATKHIKAHDKAMGDIRL